MALDALQWFRYNLGMAEKPPKMPRYNFMEKAEYWAMAWGLVLMGLTGLMLWNPIATTNILPGTFIPAAKAAHGAEAVLAVLAIILWHFYHVHIKHWNWAMIKGTHQPPRDGRGARRRTGKDRIGPPARAAASRGSPPAPGDLCPGSRGDFAGAVRLDLLFLDL